MSAPMEFLQSAKRGMESWTCGVCKNSILKVEHTGQNKYRFFCDACLNSMVVDLIFHTHDYHEYPEDYQTDETPEITEKPKRKYTRKPRVLAGTK